MYSDLARRTDCRLCESNDLELVLKLKSTPPANELVSSYEEAINQDKFPLELYICNDCKHVQMLDVVSPKRLFSNYVYVSGTSQVFINHFAGYAEAIDKNYSSNFSKKKTVFEIGSNDGTLLREFKKFDFTVLGIDPANDIASKANASGIKTICGFFGKSYAHKIKNEYDQFDIICANNVFAHIDNLSEIVESVKILLKSNGVFVIEVSYLLDVIEKKLFDTIYHEHLSYHSVYSLELFFKKFNMEIVNVTRVDTHGGSIRVEVKHASKDNIINKNVNILINKERQAGIVDKVGLKHYSEDIRMLGLELKSILEEYRAHGKKVIGYGLPAKATTLMHQFSIDSRYIDYIVDDNPLKQNKYSPGIGIKIVTSSELEVNKPDVIIILAWNFADSIIKKLQKMVNSGVDIIVPLPVVKKIKGKLCQSIM